MRCRAILLTLMLLPAIAMADAPSSSLFPRVRPSGAPVSIAAAAVAEALAAQRAEPAAPDVEPATVTPRAAPPRARRAAAEPAVPRQSAPLAEAVAQSLRPRGRPATLAAVAPTPTARRVEAPVQGRGLCGVRGLAGQELARITSSTQGCGIAEPVRITAVQGIALSPAATLDCDTARAFDAWVREALIPGMDNRGGGVERITIGSHYACRTRNNQPGARISEHGRGRAIDVMGWRLADGESVTIAEDFRRGRHRRALARMYEAACGTFRTTLGPNSDRFHQDHFHFDLAQHRNGGTYCR